MNRNIQTRQVGSVTNLTGQISNLLKHGTLAQVTGAESLQGSRDALERITGTEAASFGIGASFTDGMKNMSQAQRGAFVDSIRTLGDVSKELPAMGEQFLQYAGTEGFSQAQFAGAAAKVRGASIVLNALAHRQTDAAEALYPTITIPYQDEQLNFTVRTSGLGRYVLGASAYERASELRPVMSLIREGQYFMDDTLVLVPVYPSDAKSPNLKYFVPAADFTPVDYNYSAADALGRKTHKTSYLKVPNRIPNFLGLCEAPGALPFDETDELESNSLRVRSILLTASIGGTAKEYLLNTDAMSQMTFGLSSMGQSSDDRQLSARIQGLPSSALTNVDGTPADFSAITPAGGTVYFSLSVSGNYQRQGNSLDLQGGTFDIDYMIDADGNKVLGDTDNTTIQALYAGFTAASIDGVKMHANHTNINRTNFGYRVEVFDAHKVLRIRRQTPVSVKYPVAKEDTNEESLNFAIEQMAVVLNAQATTAAFVKASEHFDYISSISGSSIVGNEQASNVLAGQHFVQATALKRSLELAPLVSTENTEDTFDNISAAITNNLTEMAAALATNSGLAAISEYTREELKWMIVGHQNLGRYLMRSGEARTLGGYTNFKVELTNIDTMIGKFYLVPQTATDGDSIDPLGAIGVCVSKEHIVVTGQVTRNNRDFGTVITQAAFEHNSVNCIIGLLEFTDATDALTAEGLINNATAQRIYLAGSSVALNGSTAAGTNTDTSTDAGKLP